MTSQCSNNALRETKSELGGRGRVFGHEMLSVPRPVDSFQLPSEKVLLLLCWGLEMETQRDEKEHSNSFRQEWWSRALGVVPSFTSVLFPTKITPIGEICSCQRPARVPLNLYRHCQGSLPDAPYPVETSSSLPVGPFLGHVSPFSYEMPFWNRKFHHLWEGVKRTSPSKQWGIRFSTYPHHMPTPRAHTTFFVFPFHYL